MQRPPRGKKHRGGRQRCRGAGSGTHVRRVQTDEHHGVDARDVAGIIQAANAVAIGDYIRT